MQNTLIVLARALTRPVDLMVAAGEEHEWARGRARWPTECQYAANEYEMVTAVVQGVAFALEIGQGTWNKRHTGGTGDWLEAQPLAAPRLGEPGRQAVLRLVQNTNAPCVCCLPSREA